MLGVEIVQRQCSVGDEEDEEIEPVGGEKRER